MAVHIATCRFISKVFPSGRERSFLRPPISPHTDTRTWTHTRPRVAILCVQSFLATVARDLLFVPSGGVWSLSLWALHYIGDVRCARFAVSVSLEPAREVQGLYRANLFFCACDVFTFVILTGPVWFDVARARTCLGSGVVISCDRWCSGLFLFMKFIFVKNMAVIKC